MTAETMTAASANLSASQGGSRIRVLVAEDEPDIRRYLAILLRKTPTLELVGEAADTEETIRLAEALRPDVALVDVRMPGGGGARAVGQMRNLAPDTRILAYSALSDPRTVLDMLAAGATGYVVKNASPKELVQGIERAARGISTLSESIATDVRPDTEKPPPRSELVRQTLEEERTIAFQPIVELATRQVVGLEALTRFVRCAGRSPKDLFEEAGALGMRVDLELDAVRMALPHLPHLPSDAFMAVNVSPETLLSPRLQEALRSVPAHRLVIEIPDGAPFDDLGAALDALQGLRMSGARVAVDDVGAGNGGGQALLLRPDFLKLDVSLTREMASVGPRQMLARRLVGLASDLGVTVIAEGIETAEELTAARSLGVDLGQGYHLGRPALLGPAADPKSLPVSTPS